jgi:hypothetical protein
VTFFLNSVLNLLVNHLFSHHFLIVLTLILLNQLLVVNAKNEKISDKLKRYSGVNGLGP